MAINEDAHDGIISLLIVCGFKYIYDLVTVFIAYSRRKSGRKFKDTERNGFGTQRTSNLPPDPQRAPLNLIAFMHVADATTTFQHYRHGTILFMNPKIGNVREYE